MACNPTLIDQTTMAYMAIQPFDIDVAVAQCAVAIEMGGMIEGVGIV